MLASVADAGAEDGAAAWDAAVAAQESWRTCRRANAVRSCGAFEPVTERAEDFALLMTLEWANRLAEARGEVTYGAEFPRWFSEDAVRAFGPFGVPGWEVALA